jgi:hypothetical protein
MSPRRPRLDEERLDPRGVMDGSIERAGQRFIGCL